MMSYVTDNKRSTERILVIFMRNCQTRDLRIFEKRYSLSYQEKSHDLNFGAKRPSPHTPIGNGLRHENTTACMSAWF